jgi:signal transduction histidine kinase
LSVRAGGSSSMRYQHKFENSGADWSVPNAESTVTFANLSAGSYRFLVRAVNAEGVVSESPATVSFTILRPVWQRWWFLLIAAIVIASVVYLLYRYRLRQLLKVERIRTRIASDLHDDIGSSLSQIAILSEVAQHRSGGNGASEPLKLIADTSREMVDSMSDIVWAINPEKDHLSDLVQRMRRFAEDILDAGDIGYRFDMPEHLRDISLGADVRREVYLIFKECANNLVKHSGASEAKLRIRLDGEFLQIEVEDNGRGFEAAEVSSKSLSEVYETYGGNGLPNIRKRAGSLGGTFTITSSAEKGTHAVLRVPVGRNK